ncbi:MAG: hypothetical protein JNM38_01170 [Acidobacteria bacterium]|nr:hypothetical protein [Acidobacteriota bacterium]
MASSFQWSAFRGRARVRVLGGLLVLVAALAYGTWATSRLGHRGAERATFDQPIVRAAARMVRPPDRLPHIEPRTSVEVELLAIARDQQDILFGLTLLLLRLIATATVAGVGMVLLTAGSTEWEIDSRVMRQAGEAQAPRP